MYSSDLTEAEEYKRFWTTPPAISRQAPATGIPVNSDSSTTDHFSSSVDYTTTTTTTNTNGSTISQIKPKPKVPWSTGLFDCFSDVNNCMYIFASNAQTSQQLALDQQFLSVPPSYSALVVSEKINGSLNFDLVAGCITCWCPCITFGKIAEIVDKGSACKQYVVLHLYIYQLLNLC